MSSRLLLKYFAILLVLSNELNVICDYFYEDIELFRRQHSMLFFLNNYFLNEMYLSYYRRNYPQASFEKANGILQSPPSVRLSVPTN